MPRSRWLKVSELSTASGEAAIGKTIYIYIGWGTVSAVFGYRFSGKGVPFQLSWGYRFSVDKFVHP